MVETLEASGEERKASMKIGIVADSHDNVPMIKKAVEVFNTTGVDYVLHAGDYVALFAVKEFLKADAPLIGVFGNNDGEKTGIKNLCSNIHEPPHMVVLDGQKILITHDINKLNEEQKNASDIIIFGHTHEPEIGKGSPLYINPGECSGWLSGKGTVSILDLKLLDAEIVTL